MKRKLSWEATQQGKLKQGRRGDCTSTLIKQEQQKQVLFIRMILVHMCNKFRVPDYSSSESYGEKQKCIGFKEVEPTAPNSEAESQTKYTI